MCVVWTSHFCGPVRHPSEAACFLSGVVSGCSSCLVPFRSVSLFSLPLHLWSFLAAQACSEQLIRITETDLSYCLRQLNKLLSCKGAITDI